MFILHKAIRDGQIQFVEYLMKSGSQIEEKDNYQKKAGKIGTKRGKQKKVPYNT